MFKVLLDSDKYLLSFGTLINPLEANVHHMVSQILSILIDNSGMRKDIKKWKMAMFLILQGLSDRTIKIFMSLHFKGIRGIQKKYNQCGLKFARP